MHVLFVTIWVWVTVDIQCVAVGSLEGSILLLLNCCHCEHKFVPVHMHFVKVWVWGRGWGRGWGWGWGWGACTPGSPLAPSLSGSRISLLLDKYCQCALHTAYANMPFIQFVTQLWLGKGPVKKVLVWTEVSPSEGCSYLFKIESSHWQHW